jgi:hypothetical protein
MSRLLREIRNGKLQCSVCKCWKLKKEFYKSTRAKNNCRSSCKKCDKLWAREHKDEHNEYNRRWQKKNRNKVNKHQREYRLKTGYDAKWRKENRTKYNLHSKLWRERNLEKIKNLRLIRCYGLTLDDYNRLAKKQKSKCALCGKKGKLVVDHCHATDQFRGLICNNCNIGLGLLGDTLAGLQKAIKYLLGK